MLKRDAVAGVLLALLYSGCSSKPLNPAPGLALGGAGGPSSSNDAGRSADEAGAGGATLPATRTLTVFDGERISSDRKADHFQELTGEVDFGEGPLQSALLSVDLGSTCVPFASWAENAPPTGQNWPADCDAFDRNFEISLDDPPSAGDAGAKQTAGLELVRAITPFGGPLHLDHDLTAVASWLSGVHRLRVRINTWPDPAGLVSGSAGGWSVTLKVVLSSAQSGLRPLLVQPLFYGDLTSKDSASFAFITPPGTKRAYVEYRSTGHGAAAGGVLECSGPAEEFCRRQHEVSLDGVAIATFTPWRQCTSLCTLSHDAARNIDYCAENPCGDVNSVKAPRANWCPGSESLPRVIEDAALAAPGAHELAFHLSDIAEGGSVRISATYFAFAE